MVQPPIHNNSAMRYINEIIIHCSDTPPTHDWGAKEITVCHKQRGFRTCGYHYVVRIDGTVEKGRNLSEAGAHCKGFNAHSIGICYIGGRDAAGHIADTRTPSQKAALLKLITSLTHLYRCKTTGHNDHCSYKTCPNFDARKEYGNILPQILKINPK